MRHLDVGSGCLAEAGVVDTDSKRFGHQQRRDESAGQVVT